MMQKKEYEEARPDFPEPDRDPRNHVVIWDLAREYHVGRNTVANIAKEVSIQFKYENFRGKTRAYVSNDEADKIRQVLNKRYSSR